MAVEVMLHLPPADGRGHGQEELKVGSRPGEYFGSLPQGGEHVADLSPPAAGQQADYGPGGIEAHLA